MMVTLEFRNSSSGNDNVIVMGGMVGEGIGCDLKLRCAAGQTIKEVVFADWGLPYATGAGAEPTTPGPGCSFASNNTPVGS